MSIDLVNYQWEIGNVVFGIGCDIDHEPTVDPGSYGITSADQAIPNGDGLLPGIDTFQPDTWKFLMFTNVQSESDALTAAAELAKVWRGDDVRRTSGAVVPLRYCLRNETRRVYGRPRKWDAPLDAKFHGGNIPITADFQKVSELFFSDDEFSVEMSLGTVGATGGGLSDPLTDPMSDTSANVTNAVDFGVLGELPTPMIVEFDGPLLNGAIDLDGVFTISTSGFIPFGSTLVIDARPWVSAATWKAGGGAGNMLSRHTRLPKLKLEVGGHTATFSGTDPTGTAKARVKWRTAHPTI